MSEPGTQHEGEAAVSASVAQVARRVVDEWQAYLGSDAELINLREDASVPWTHLQALVQQALAEARRAERERRAQAAESSGWTNAECFAALIRALPDDQVNDIPDAKP